MSSNALGVAVSPAGTASVYSYDVDANTSGLTFVADDFGGASLVPATEQTASWTGDLSAARLVFVAAETAGSADTVVLGHYPEYVDVAKATGGRTFQVPTKAWDSMTPEQQWAANQKFLDRAIARGSSFQLATPANAAREGSYFERELQYMQSKGYTIAPDGMSLLPPGGG